jgi:hypothetical protein
MTTKGVFDPISEKVIDYFKSWCLSPVFFVIFREI